MDILRDYFSEKGLVDIIYQYSLPVIILEFEFGEGDLGDISFSGTETGEVTVVWGDGVIDDNYDHHYNRPGTYEVKIIGFLDNLYRWNSGIENLTRVINIEQSVLKRCSFTGATRLTDFYGDVPKSIINMSYMFGECSIFNPERIVFMNSGKVKDMDLLFYRCYALNPSGGIKINSSAVKSMNSMYAYCHSLNCEIQLETQNVEDMNYMFADCMALNRAYHFDTSSLKTNINMFVGSRGRLE